MRLCKLSALGLFGIVVLAQDDGSGHEHLPLDSQHHGILDSDMREPVNKSHIVPVKVFQQKGQVSGADSVLQGSSVESTSPWCVIGAGGSITFEFQERIAGR